MNTWHIHIGGLVQGVGFRPFVYRIAQEMKINGWVSNGNDGVHIKFNATKELAEEFYHKMVTYSPANSIINSHSCNKITHEIFNDFIIKESLSSAKPDLLLTPDIAICSNCKKEIKDSSNSRYQYPFTTCLECGPRYSIITELPYDRVHTTMNELQMCIHCNDEYNDPHNRRHFSQTNSCSSCGIPMHLYDKEGTEICNEPSCILIMVEKALQDGHIIAVKGIGGYLLLCDATNSLSIQTLRDRKHRPAKPFALLYPSVEWIEKDVFLNTKEKESLSNKAAPVVLCKLRDKTGSGVCTSAVAPGLDKVGIMLPYTPLFLLISEKFGKPLVATSGNLSGSPIIYTDDDALLSLCDHADFILSFDRDIVASQDDSVVQFTEKYQHQIILRRSRGLAPNYYPSPFDKDNSVLATGAELKSAFAILNEKNLYVGQFLGDQGNYESQISYKNTLQHLVHLLQFKPEQILIDSHPNYFVSQTGKELADQWDVPFNKVQHHKAHFCAALAENDLLNSDETILGVVWDGTGFGDDGQIWGGEFFLLEDDDIERYAHLDYFPQLIGDKMSKEPRVSAVSLLRNNIDHLMMIREQFSVEEREFYLKLLQQKQDVLTSSAGRLIDGIASILKLQSYNSYEGEAAMKLEAEARKCKSSSLDYYPIAINKSRLEWSRMIEEIMIDKTGKVEAPIIARKVFVSLAMLIKNVATRSGVNKICFSGGVFQNALLVDLIYELMSDDFELFFHRQLSPNDECIGFGQIAYWQLMQNRQKKFQPQQELIINQ